MLKRNKLALLTAMLISGTAVAGVNGNDVYFGVGFGQSYLDPDYKDGTGAEEDYDLAVQGFMGYDITDNFAIEASYADLGDLDAADLGYSVSSLQALISLPSSSDAFSVYGKIGGSYIDVDTSTGEIDSGYDTELSGGLGVRWNMDDNWFARAEYNYYNEDLQAAYLQFAYAFGGSEPEPAPVVVAAPVVAEAVVEPEPSIMLIGDNGVSYVFFPFDSSELTDEAKATLDEAAQILTSQQEVPLTVTGSADKSGNADYNEKLAQKRSDAVKAYLVSKGVNPDIIDSESIGVIDDANIPAEKARAVRVEMNDTGM